MPYVNGARTMFGNGVMKRVIVGGYLWIFGRISSASLYGFPAPLLSQYSRHHATPIHLLSLFFLFFGWFCDGIWTVVDARTWERIAYIAEIQARTWMYSGPYGYGDMDMLGTPLPPPLFPFSLCLCL